jgi:hypothetical protein
MLGKVMKFSLRSLMIVLAVLPPLLALGWVVVQWIRSEPKPNIEYFVYPGDYLETLATREAEKKAAIPLPTSQAKEKIPPKK